MTPLPDHLGKCRRVEGLPKWPVDLDELMARPTSGVTRYKGERVPVQLMVAPAIRDRLRTIRGATGLSYADYVEELIRRDELSANGVPTWHPAAADEPDQQQLNLSA